MKVKVTCEYCKKEFLKHQSEIKRHPHNLCSYKCANEWRKGRKKTDVQRLHMSLCKRKEKNPMWKGDFAGRSIKSL